MSKGGALINMCRHWMLEQDAVDIGIVLSSSIWRSKSLVLMVAGSSIAMRLHAHATTGIALHFDIGG